MKIAEVSALLQPTPMKLEMGYERLADGVLHIACRTDMHQCTGAMFEWWFRSRPDTERYIWWHPVDHVASHWAEGSEDTHIGSIHLAEEFFTGMPAAQLAIQFRDPTEFFHKQDYELARANGHISAAVCGRVGLGFDAPRTERNEMLGSRLLHLGRDTSWGLVLRSHFYMGVDLVSMGKTAEEITTLFSDQFAECLLMHCYNEFTFLSRFLPSLYIGKHRDHLQVAVPW